MKKRPKSTNYLGMEGKGPTLREAKADAMRKIEKALTWDYRPALFTAGEHQTIVWRTPFGVMTSTLASGHNGDIQINGMSGSDRFEHECDAMALHVAKLAANIEAPTIPSCIASRPGLVSDYLYWIGFQRAFAAAAGDHSQRHRFACDNASHYKPKFEECV